MTRGTVRPAVTVTAAGRVGATVNPDAPAGTTSATVYGPGECVLVLRLVDLVGVGMGEDPLLTGGGGPSPEFGLDSEEIQQEDIAICEAVQRGLASGHYDAGRLCPRRESGLWHFHQLLHQAYSHTTAAAP